MKTITADNWLQIDSVIASALFVRLSPADASIRSITDREWVERFLQLQLSPNVPAEIRELFTVARGAMIYGVLFYPLFTLGLEQILRVWRQQHAPKPPRLA